MATRLREAVMFVLVRHADAGDKHQWPDRDVLRPLSEKGMRQAEGAVAGLLGRLAVRRMISSPAVRCLQTLEPAARTLGLTPEARDELAVHAGVDGLLALLDELGDVPTALCTHGEVLTELSRAWGRTGRMTFEAVGHAPDLHGTPKGACWIVEGYDSTTATARYVPTHRHATR
jgi:phosphohistidine phosphatase SixA